jgi:hypothetical protein
MICASTSLLMPWPPENSMNFLGSFAKSKNCFPLANGMNGSLAAWKIQTGRGVIFVKYVLGSTDVANHTGFPE